jgi:hypothetical protein
VTADVLEYRERSPARRRKELRRLERRLGERMGKPLAVADRAGEPGAVLSFMELEGS